MIDVKELFRGRKADKKALEQFGFKRTDGGYEYGEDVLGGQFRVIVSVKDEEVNARVYDVEAECDYYLFAVEGASGAFVGGVRAEYDRILQSVSDRCFARVQRYREKTTMAAVAYAKAKYGSAAEFLWHDENSVVRRRDNCKWYAVFMVVDKSKLGLEGEGRVEIIDVLAPKEEISGLIDNKRYFPAYHMNKKSWVTILSDGGVDKEIIYGFLDISYNLAGGKKK